MIVSVVCGRTSSWFLHSYSFFLMTANLLSSYLHGSVNMRGADSGASWLVICLFLCGAGALCLGNWWLQSGCSRLFCAHLLIRHCFHCSQSQSLKGLWHGVRGRSFVFTGITAPPPLFRVVLSCAEQMFPWIKYMSALEWGVGVGVLTAKQSSSWRHSQM